MFNSTALLLYFLELVDYTRLLKLACKFEVPIHLFDKLEFVKTVFLIYEIGVFSGVLF